MRLLSGIAVAALVCVAPFYVPSPAQQETPVPSIKAEDIVSVTFDRGGGLGGRNYSFALSKSGDCVYIGQGVGPRTGSWRGKLDKREWARLTSFLVQQGFFELQDDYGQQAIDLSAVTLTVKYGDGKEKRVSDIGDAGPFSLWAMQCLTEGVAEHATWAPAKPLTPKPLDTKP